MLQSEYIHYCYYNSTAGSGEQHCIRDNGEKKSVEFEATVSSFNLYSASYTYINLF